MANPIPTTTEGSAKPQFRVVVYNGVGAAQERFRNIPSANTVRPGTSDRLVIDMLDSADFELTPDVVTIHTEKGFQPGQPAGSFSITMIDRVANPTSTPGLAVRPIVSRRGGVPFPSWIAALYPDDIIFIAMNDGGPQDKWNAVMLGLIDRIGRIVEIQGERGVRRLNISGRDIGKWFMNARLDFVLQTTGLYGLRQVEKEGNTEVGFVDDRDTLLAYVGSAPKSVTDALTTFIMEHHLGLAKLVKPNIQPETRFEEYAVDPLSIGTWDNNAWELLEQLSFRPWCELWCDTTNEGLFQLNFRRTPFDLSDWRNLKTWDIPLQFIQSFNFGFADHERVNFIVLEPQASGDAAELRLIPEFTRAFLPSILLHGLMPRRYRSRFFNFERISSTMDIPTGGDGLHFYILGSNKQAAMKLSGTSGIKSATSTSFARFLTEDDSKFVKLGRSWSSTLWSWFSGSHLLQNGNGTIKGMSGIKVGDRVAFPSADTNTALVPNLIFYVMSVSHQFNYPDEFKTTLTLNRGETDRATASRLDAALNDPEFNGVRHGRQIHKGIVEHGTTFLDRVKVKIEAVNDNWAKDREIKKKGDTIPVTAINSTLDEARESR